MGDLCGLECPVWQINHRYVGTLRCGLDAGHSGVHEATGCGERWYGSVPFPPNEHLRRR